MGDSSGNEASLTILGGSKAGQRFIVEESVDNIVIGSDPSCRFQIDLPGVSPVHARIWIDPQGVTVYETNSPRGLYVNDDRVVAQAPLRNGDVLWLGTPGDEDVVMIQCRFPQARGEVARAVPMPQSLAEAAMGETLAIAASAASAEPEESEPEEIAEAVEPDEAGIEPHDVDIEPHEATAVEPDEAGIEPEEVYDADPVIETEAVVPTPPTEVFMVEDDGPVIAAEPAKFDMDFTKPDLPPSFEEEIHDAAAAAAPDPEPPPPPPVAPPDPPPVIAAPPPPPPPRQAAAPPPPPAPRRAVARPVAAPATAPPADSGGLPPAVKWGGLAAGLVVLGLGGYAGVRMMSASAPTQPPQPRATVAATPAVVAQASAGPTFEPVVATPEPPPIQEEVTIVPPPVVATPAPTPTPGQRGAATPTPSPRPSATPRPTQQAAATPAPMLPTPAPADPQGPQLASLVLGLLGQAESAAGARDFDAAIGHYDEVLKRDPQNGRAVEGKAAAQSAAASLKRTFVPGRTSMSGKAAKAEGLGGFDTSGVTVAKVPDYSGRVEFEVSPASVLPGDGYTVRIFLMNDGKKAFKVGSVAVNTTTNGTRAGGSVPVRAREVEPKDRIVLDERTGEWPAGVQSWTLEALVQTDRDATFTNRLNWR